MIGKWKSNKKRWWGEQCVGYWLCVDYWLCGGFWLCVEAIIVFESWLQFTFKLIHEYAKWSYLELIHHVWLSIRLNNLIVIHKTLFYTQLKQATPCQCFILSLSNTVQMTQSKEMYDHITYNEIDWFIELHFSSLYETNITC